MCWKRFAPGTFLLFLLALNCNAPFAVTEEPRLRGGIEAGRMGGRGGVKA